MNNGEKNNLKILLIKNGDDGNKVTFIFCKFFKNFDPFYQSPTQLNNCYQSNV